MKNIKELRDEQIKVYDQLKNGDIGQSQAKELSNIAGKILTSSKIQMDYNRMTGNGKKRIKFLESDE